MSDGFRRVEQKIDGLDVRIQQVERDVTAIKAVSELPKPEKPQWPAIVNSIVAIVTGLFSMATLLILIIGH